MKNVLNTTATILCILIFDLFISNAVIDNIIKIKKKIQKN
jgi:hypothetical protein